MKPGNVGGFRNLSGKLNSRQMRFLAGFLLSGNVSEAARRVPVSRAQVYRWLEDVVFQSVFTGATRAHYEMARHMLIAGSVNAATKFLESIDEGDGKLAAVLLDRMGVFPKAEVSFGTIDPDLLQHLQEFEKEREENEKTQLIRLMGRDGSPSNSEANEGNKPENDLNDEDGKEERPPKDAA